MSSSIIDWDAKSFPTPSGNAILLTVLVSRIEGTKKAYAGIVGDVSLVDPDYNSVKEWVKSNGNPLRYVEANEIWPMGKEEYAR